MDKTFQDDYDLEFARDDDIPEEELTEDQKRLRELQALTNEMVAEKRTAMNDKKNEVEPRLVHAARAYKGYRDREGNETLEEQFDAPKVNNRVYLNITKQITNDGASQLGDLLFPSDDKNYGMKAVEIPEPPLTIAQAPAVDSKGEPLLDDQGNQLTNQQAHNRRVERMRRKTNRMFKRIDTALIDGKYPQKGRQCIRDAAIYGTGILKGPVITKAGASWAKKKGGEYKLKASEKLSPSVKVVNPFDFFPDLSATTPDEWGYTWERSFIRPMELQKMAVKLGFDKRETSRLLAQGPSPVPSLDDDAREVARENTFSASLSVGRFEMWERRGAIHRKHLQAAGVEPGTKDIYVDCILYMVQDRVMKVVVNPFEKDDTVYSLFNWDEDPMSVFGYGIPYLMADPQHAYNTAWRMTIDNSGIATQPQVVIDRKQIKPMDGSNDYSLSAGKVWERTGEVYSNERNDKPFDVFTIGQDIQQLFTLMDKAEESAYELTGVTRVDKQQQVNDNAPLTLGATQIQQNNSSVSRRSQARRYDDQITSTLIERFYNFFMQFEPNDDIKGLMVVEPRGSTILLSKELQASNLMTFYQVTQGGQSEGVKGLELLRAISASMQHPVGQFIYTDDEMQRIAEQQAQQEQQVDPSVAAMERESAIKEAEIELKQGELQLKFQIAQSDYQLKVEETQRRLELEYMKLSASERQNSEKTQAAFAQLDVKSKMDFDIKMFQEKTKRDIATASINSKRLSDQEASLKANSELSLRKQEADRKDLELQNKITTGQSGI